MISDKQFLEILENSVQHHLGFLFTSESECEGYGIYDDTAKSFEWRKQLFLWCLQKALDENYLRLAKNGVFLEETNEQQVQKFREMFPHTEKGLENGIWFWMEECPGEAVWILDYQLGDITEPIGDGRYYYWT